MDRNQLIKLIYESNKGYSINDLERMSDFQLRSLAQRIMSEERLKSKDAENVTRDELQRKFFCL